MRSAAGASLRSVRSRHQGGLGSFPFLAGALAITVAALVPAPASARVKLEAEPPLRPAFSPAVSDYVVDCSAGSVSVDARARGRHELSVDGSSLGRRAKSAVPLTAGQSFEIVLDGRKGKSRHYVRCLPSDYPEYEFVRSRAAAAGQYAFGPTIGSRRGVPAYVAIFDGAGAPIWWHAVRGSTPVDTQVLEDGRIAYGYVPFFRGEVDGYDLRAVDGKRTELLQADGGRTDTHELIELDDGGYALISNPILTGVDLTPYGGPAEAAIFDDVIEEFDAEGELTSSWSAYEHLDLDEARDWWPATVALPEQVEGVGAVYNPFHINSVELWGRGYLISFRRTNSIYRTKGSGEIAWKLGGTKTEASLKVRRDPLAPRTFGGQHDARILEDGTVTVFDNGTREDRVPRAVRFEIDAKAGKAKLLSELRDDSVPASTCCGSFRTVGDAGVVGWGADYAGEYGADGKPNWQLRTPGLRSYRVVPVPEGRVSDAELRAGMDAKFPRRPPECTGEGELVPARGSATPGDDELRGRRDVPVFIRGLAGADRIDARAGDDCVLGDGGADRIEGGPGDDRLLGGQGSDRIEGGRGADTIACGGGQDLAIVKGGDQVSDNCERVRRAGKKPRGGPNRDS